VEIVEVTPRDVDVTLETEVAKPVTVQVNRSGQLPAGYSVGTIEASPFEARVIGALSRVQLVQSAAVDVSLTGARTTLQGQYRLTPIDSTGAEVPRVRVEPSNAEVRIVINQQEAILVLPVQVVTQGTPAEGYRVVSAAANPQVVALTGTHETLQGVTELLTDPIDISGVSADVTRSATVKIPPGLKATRESVNVSIRVVPQQGERLVQVAPEVINVPPGLNATSQTTSLSVQVRGDVPLINALPPGAVRATVNAANLPEGVHVLMPDIVVPPGVTFVAVQPPQVVVVIGR
jgi:YbbR domain-containing protein